VTGASFDGTTRRGFTEVQLQSTASYQAKDLWGVGLGSNGLNGWDFSGQNLTSADFFDSGMTDANLAGANLRNAVTLQPTEANREV
jgi:uncharacterized protein YjbI with pentapeptide repeats